LNWILLVFALNVVYSDGIIS